VKIVASYQLCGEVKSCTHCARMCHEIGANRRTNDTAYKSSLIYASHRTSFQLGSTTFRSVPSSCSLRWQAAVATTQLWPCCCCWHWQASPTGSSRLGSTPGRAPAPRPPSPPSCGRPPRPTPPSSLR
jgi:hypothetical protein